MTMKVMLLKSSLVMIIIKQRFKYITILSDMMSFYKRNKYKDIHMFQSKKCIVINEDIILNIYNIAKKLKITYCVA